MLWKCGVTLLSLQTPLGLDYKDCLIIENEHYSLPGVQKSFSSLRELTSYYQHNKLLLADVPVKLSHCCPPRPKGEQKESWMYQKLIHSNWMGCFEVLCPMYEGDCQSLKQGSNLPLLHVFPTLSMSFLLPFKWRQNFQTITHKNNVNIKPQVCFNTDKYTTWPKKKLTPGFN